MEKKITANQEQLHTTLDIESSRPYIHPKNTGPLINNTKPTIGTLATSKSLEESKTLSFHPKMEPRGGTNFSLFTIWRSLLKLRPTESRLIKIFFFPATCRFTIFVNFFAHKSLLIYGTDWSQSRQVRWSSQKRHRMWVNADKMKKAFAQSR